MIATLIRFLKWLTLADYDEAKEKATRDAIDMTDNR